ncbi:hypothetical protein [Thalassobaculum sp.]|uniref:hypothetical protein n=1 Tax=Thalassobaculum sp. TaxID=2022740 RepID=UPI0032EBE795
MSLDQLQSIFLLVQVAQIAVTAAIALWTVVSRRQKANASEIDALRRDLAHETGRINLVEQQVKHLPDQGSVGRIYEEIRKITNGLAGLEATVTAQGTSLGQIANNVTALVQHELATSKK